MTKTVCNNKQN